MLVGLVRAEAGEPGFLKESWRLPGASSQTVVVRDALGTSLLSLVSTGASRSLVRVEALTGRVEWQTEVVPGVGWGSFAVRGDEAILQGASLSDGAAQVALVAITNGERKWSRALPTDVRLEFGQNGGLALEGDCGLTVLDARGLDLATFRGLRAESGVGSLCVARPRLLGEVADRVIVEVPGAHDTWRLDAVGAGGTGWTADLGALTASPEVDWRTGVFWTRSAEGLVFERYNLATGRVAWRSVREVRSCDPVVRAVTGPAGAPAILVQACDAVTLVDPHDGIVTWQVLGGSGDAIVDGEGFGLPEWIQPTETGRSVRWLDRNGKPNGHATVGPGCFGIPVAEGVLTRCAGEVALVGRDGAAVWTVPLANPRWALLGDLLVVAPELGETRLLVRRATGEVLGRFAGGEAIGSVPVAGSEVQRLVFAQGTELRALKVTVRP